MVLKASVAKITRQTARQSIDQAHHACEKARDRVIRSRELTERSRHMRVDSAARRAKVNRLRAKKT
jgi:hypothetical protein